MQCKDIPDLPILEFINGFNGAWTFMFGERSVRGAMPPETPYRLALAKMRMLMKRKLVDGCGCGCRGDFVLTDKGKDYLAGMKRETV